MTRRLAMLIFCTTGSTQTSDALHSKPIFTSFRFPGREARRTSGTFRMHGQFGCDHVWSDSDTHDHHPHEPWLPLCTSEGWEDPPNRMSLLAPQPEAGAVYHGLDAAS